MEHTNVVLEQGLVFCWWNNLRDTQRKAGLHIEGFLSNRVSVWIYTLVSFGPLSFLKFMSIGVFPIMCECWIASRPKNANICYNEKMWSDFVRIAYLLLIVIFILQCLQVSSKKLCIFPKVASDSIFFFCEFCVTIDMLGFLSQWGS